VSTVEQILGLVKNSMDNVLKDIAESYFCCKNCKHTQPLQFNCLRCMNPKSRMNGLPVHELSTCDFWEDKEEK